MVSFSAVVADVGRLVAADARHGGNQRRVDVNARLPTPPAKLPVQE
jgi:hypothetical protein